MNILYILLAVLIFGFLIFVHELGHYTAARIAGVKIIEFSIGMGPKLFAVTSKKTGIKYSLRLFPIGGFVNMEGEGEYSNPTADKAEEDAGIEVVEPEEKPDDNDPRSYKNKPAWVKILILLSGPLMNIIVGFIITFIMVLTVRTADGQIYLSSNTIHSFQSGAVSAETGLMEGDVILKVGGVSVHTGQELAYEISMQGKSAEVYEQQIGFDTIIQRDIVKLDLTVRRGGETVVLKDVAFPADSNGGILFGSPDFYVFAEVPNFGNVIKQSWFRSLSSVKMVWDSLAGIVTGRFGISSVSGPVGAAQVITEAAKTSSYMLLYIFSVIAMNLGVVNLFPFLPLDGGHIVFALYELIARKPAPKKAEEICQLIGVVAMFGLMIVITVKDIVNLF